MNLYALVKELLYGSVLLYKHSLTIGITIFCVILAMFIAGMLFLEDNGKLS
ncbi:hypothetical protein JOD43_003865 [Pullulanibacillus pueri]|nr:hypothetical protein [Pullulanibacillus pueri]